MDYECKVLSNTCLKGEYFRIVFSAPGIAAKAKAGQFVHVRIPTLRDRILRRPFSINDTDPEKGLLTVTYKKVGRGTAELAGLPPGAVCSVMGPQGKGYTLPDKETFPILVAGGYGSAATFLLAKHAPRKGVLLLGARSGEDLILAEEYERVGFPVKIATNDGSVGHKGFVTELLEEALAEAKGKKAFVYGCGPEGMLFALGKLCLAENVKAELSLDRNMCCGTGACFACVVKVKDESAPEKWRYSRSCKEGPVYGAEELYYG
ncbi:MAG: dihydroorotate dehydrogenase electron transfer subunit [Lentisphaeria bacterium]|nr:dihydroorotate dehydrogenase electron transfer subunit [Lentisphaeria bacterium]